MNGRCDHVLAGAGFSGNQYGNVFRGCVNDPLEDFLHRQADPQHAFEFERDGSFAVVGNAIAGCLLEKRLGDQRVDLVASHGMSQGSMGVGSQTVKADGTGPWIGNDDNVSAT